MNFTICVLISSHLIVGSSLSELWGQMCIPEAVDWHIQRMFGGLPLRLIMDASGWSTKTDKIIQYDEDHKFWYCHVRSSMYGSIQNLIDALISEIWSSSAVRILIFAFTYVAMSNKGMKFFFFSSVMETVATCSISCWKGNHSYLQQKRKCIICKHGSRDTARLGEEKVICLLVGGWVHWRVCHHLSFRGFGYCCDLCHYLLPWCLRRLGNIP